MQQKGVRWSLDNVGSEAMFQEKGCWEWIWGQERGKTFGSATSGILRRNNKHSLYGLDFAFPVLFCSREAGAGQGQALGLRRLQKVKAGGGGRGGRGKHVVKMAEHGFQLE